MVFWGEVETTLVEGMCVEGMTASCSSGALANGTLSMINDVVGVGTGDQNVTFFTCPSSPLDPLIGIVSSASKCSPLDP